MTSTRRRTSTTSTSPWTLAHTDIQKNNTHTQLSPKGFQKHHHSSHSRPSRLRVGLFEVGVDDCGGPRPATCICPCEGGEACQLGDGGEIGRVYSTRFEDIVSFSFSFGMKCAVMEIQSRCLTKFLVIYKFGYSSQYAPILERTRAELSWLRCSSSP